MSAILGPAKYIQAGDMSADVNGPIIATARIGNLTFTGEWVGTGAPIGELRLYGTDDPRAYNDFCRGLNRSNGTATWHQCDLPTGSAKATGGGTVGATAIAINTSAGTFIIDVTESYAYMCLAYIRTSGGAANTTLGVRRAGR